MENLIRPLLQRPKAAIMGIVNVTPDSFSDGGQFLDVDSALLYALNLIEEGADIIDIGGESTRPGAVEISLQQELDRVIPIIERIHGETTTPISIDTHKPQVMLAAVEAGASLINDINALRADGAIQVAALSGVPVCLMHMLGEPKTMQKSPVYSDVVSEVIEFLSARIEVCQKAGIALADIVIDPGIGFGKALEHNLVLLNAIPRFCKILECELLIGVSRKSMIDAILGRAVDKRLAASIGLAVQAVINGAKIIRVHDVRATYDAIRCVEAVSQA